MESGDIYFAYRPGLGYATDVQSGVARLCLVMASLSQRRYRLIDVQSARMPDPDGGSKHKSIVLHVADEPEEVESALAGGGAGSHEYASLLPAGAGEYTLSRYGSRMILDFTLNEDDAMNELWSRLNIRSEAAYIVTVSGASPEPVADGSKLLDATGSVMTLEPVPGWMAEEIGGYEASKDAR